MFLITLAIIFISAVIGVSITLLNRNVENDDNNKETTDFMTTTFSDATTTSIITTNNALTPPLRDEGIVKREDWAANPPQDGIPLLQWPIKRIIIAHTADSDFSCFTEASNRN